MLGFFNLFIVMTSFQKSGLDLQKFEIHFNYSIVNLKNRIRKHSLITFFLRYFQTSTMVEFLYLKQFFLACRERAFDNNWGIMSFHSLRFHRSHRNKELQKLIVFPIMYRSSTEYLCCKLIKNSWVNFKLTTLDKEVECNT